ncbi:MAG: hypothetical protein IKE60_00310 [Reyranella sp.]|uniref:hypothetical protein n=1 Tax=Reyranella sp. TaxID=1929291 RepID=UPI0025F42F01|nr:hypothetical protein [Reyranella sp.]MBR2813062.1 hypothetical protein [Reyranella sp.]
MSETLLDSSAEGVEGAAERDDLGGVARQDGGESWAQKAVVGSSAEESGAPAEVGDAMSMTVRQALDHAVGAQATELIGDGAAADGLG